MDRMQAPYKTLLAAFSLLVTLASAAHAQVVHSYLMQEPEPDWSSGPAPYEFLGAEKQKLVALATRTASPGAMLLSLDAHKRHVRGRKVAREDAHAALLFGPYDLRDDTFSLDFVSCTLDRYQWNCTPGDTRTYLYVGERKVMVSFGGDVTREIAGLIARHEFPICPLPTIEKERRADRDVILSTPHIHFNKETGEYDRSGDRCGNRFRIRDGKIVEGAATVS